MDDDEFFPYFILGCIIVGIILFGILPFMHDISDDHFDTHIVLEVVGHANQDVSKSMGGGSRTVCIMEDSSGKRYSMYDMCKFLKGDILDATMHHGNRLTHLSLQENTNG